METQSVTVLSVLIVMEMVSLFANSFPKMNGIKSMLLICRFALITGAVLCSQCKGSGVNSVDFFGGQFKAGDSCWLCGQSSQHFSLIHYQFHSSCVYV